MPVNGKSLDSICPTRYPDENDENGIDKGGLSQAGPEQGFSSVQWLV